MAEEAVALSPHPLRLSPSAADFETIHSVFQETARGRWFLDELNRRNRNADTLMVLDAVARIEASLAERPAPEPPPVSAEIADILAEARAALDTAITPPTTSPETEARQAIQGLREIVWTMRECGIDARICDLLDSQVGLIEDGVAHPLPDDHAATAQATLDRLARRLAALTARAAPEPGAETTAAAGEAAGCPETTATSSAPVAAVAMALPDLPAAIADAPAVDLPEATTLLPEEPPPPGPAPETVAANARNAATPSPAGAVSASDDDDKDDGPSLGAILLADGLVPMPEAARGDAFAAFARMSKAETIAFFS